MWWLNEQSRQIEEERAAIAAAAAEAVRDWNAGDLLSDPRGAVGRRVVIDEIAIASGLGDGVFSVSLSDDITYPVLMESDPIQRLRMANVTIYGGDRVYVSGQVYTFNDSISTVWVDQGAVNEGMGDQIPASPTFLLADSVVVR
tara:strand:- start:47 stop:478 length:432 start_codon:yes stop_codon:yes gene_type:complete